MWNSTTRGDVQTVRITIRGGYTPSRIRARVGTPLRLVFDRQESGDCTSRVVFADFGVSADLPAFTETTVEFFPTIVGEFGFACGMNMIHGVLTVEETATPPGAVVASSHETPPDRAGAETVATQRSQPSGPQTATIIVEGGYHPSTSLASAGEPLRLVFDRHDEGACTDRVLVPALGIDASLAAHARTTVDLPPLEAGRYNFSCGMQMVHGQIDVSAGADAITAPTIHAATRAPQPSPVVVPAVVRDGSARPKTGAGADDARLRN